MAIGSNSAKLLFQIDGDSSGLKRELAAAEGSLGKFGSQFNSIAGIATAAAGAIAVMGTAVFTAGKYLFDLTKAASDYGSAINDATLKSGASVQSIQALGFAAEQSGGSLEAIAGSVAKFSNLLGQASLGNEKAQETLKKYGITATEVDAALTQAIAKIQSMTDETQQNAAASELFKDRGGEVVKTIREMGGSLPDTIKKLEEMGIMMSKEDTKAADAFGDSLDLLGTQAKLMGYRFANEFMPDVTRAIQDISRFLIANKDVIKGWGRDIGIVISGVSNTFRLLPQVISGVFNSINILFGTSLSTTASWANGMRFILGPIGELFRMIAPIGNIGGDIASGASTAASNVGSAIATPKLNTGGGKGGGGKSGKSAEDLNREAFQEKSEELKRMLATYEAVSSRIIAKAELDLAKGLVDETQVADLKMAIAERVANYKITLLERELDAARTFGQKTVDLESQIGIAKTNRQELEFQNETAQLNRSAEQQKKIQQALADFAKETSDGLHDQLVRNANADLAKAKEVYNDAINNTRLSKKEKLDALAVLQREQTKFYNAMMIEERARHENAVDNLDRWKRDREKEIKDAIKDEEERKGALQGVNDEYERRLQLLKDTFAEIKKSIEDEGPSVSVDGSPAKHGPFQSLIDSYQQFVELVQSSAPTLTATMQSIGGMFVNAFAGMANALGSVVEQWVLMGSTGPAIMRKILAQALASIAAEAAVRAIWELALGFATLFTNPAESSGHFIAAALFGSVAVGAALAGRAVAGNAFKQQNQAATGQSSSTANSGQGSAGKAGVYSSQEDMTVERGRNTPMGRLAVELVVRSRDAFADMFAFEISKNGRLRSAIQDAAAA